MLAIAGYYDGANVQFLEQVHINKNHKVKQEDGPAGYVVLDGQQRTLSLCEYVDGTFSVNGMVLKSRQLFGLRTGSRRSLGVVDHGGRAHGNYCLYNNSNDWYIFFQQ